MLTKLKQNKEMALTVMSGILIIIGFIAQANHINPTIIFALAFIIGGFFAAKEGFTELFIDKHLSVDILMVLAAIGASVIGYWLEGSLLIFIFSLAESLETMAMNKSQNAISALMQLTPDTARKYVDGELVEIATESLVIGDIIQVRKGEIVPIDAALLSEYAQINEASITGESIPVEKEKGDKVVGGTLNQSESFDATVITDTNNTLFSKIIKMVEQAQSTPSKTASFIENIEDVYVKIVLISVPLFIAFMHFAFHLDWLTAFYRGMVLLTVASPCALVASATPATLSAISRATKNNILFKGGITLDNTHRIKAIVFDKTGTLTTGKPTVETSYYRHNQAEVEQVVKSVEVTSSHPIALALTKHLNATPTVSLDSIRDLTGYGFDITKGGDNWKVGKQAFALPHWEQLTAAEQLQIKQLEEKGASVVYVSHNAQFVAFYGLMDTIKEDSKHTIQQLHRIGIQTIMLTGDHEQSAQFIAKQLSIDEVRANCLPDDKANVIAELQRQYGEVAMVGDGINDAPALAVANVSFAMGSGTDVAMETADVVLMKDDLTQIPFSVGLSKQLHGIIIQNIVFSLSVILLLIVSNVFQWISLPLGVVGHEGSTILVILNGLRLLGYKDK